MSIRDAIEELEDRKKNTRFKRLVAICAEVFVAPRIRGGHHIFKTPWPGDPRINLQKVTGVAKPYQIRQVLAALKKLTESQPR